MTIFEQVKECVTARQAAEHYGIKVKGNGMACCPFHKDRHPSMKADKIYHCFACGVGGDAIDFTARLFGLSQYEAAKRLIEDFRLDIHIEDKGKRRRIGNRAPLKTQKPKVVLIREKLEQWLNYATDVLIRYLRWIQFWKEFYKPNPEEEWHELFTEALANERRINDYTSVLQKKSRKKQRNCRKNSCRKIPMQELSRHFLMIMKMIMYVQNYCLMMHCTGQVR